MFKIEEFWHFYDKFTAEAPRAQGFFVKNLSLRPPRLRGELNKVKTDDL